MIGPMIVGKVKMISNTPINSKRHDPAPVALLRLVMLVSLFPHLGQFMFLIIRTTRPCLASN
ncbi:MAG: hypothetical protein ACMUIP_14400 [bacterium]